MARATRQALDLTLLTSQFVKAQMQVIWPYVKVECAPPMTMALLQGSLGKSLENTVSGAANSFINAIQTQIRNMDAAVEKKKREAEAAIIAAQEKVKAEEQKKKLAAEKKALDAKLKAAEAAKKKESEKKAPEKPAKKAAPKGQQPPPAKTKPKKK